MEYIIKFVKKFELFSEFLTFPIFSYLRSIVASLNMNMIFFIHKLTKFALNQNHALSPQLLNNLKAFVLRRPLIICRPSACYF